VDFDLSDDQVALRDSARALLADLATTVRVRAVADSEDRVDPDLWRAMVEQGWLAVALPEADGGLGLGTVEVAVLLEQIGAHVAPVPFLPSVLAIDVLRAAGRVDELRGLLAGERVACVAWSRRPDAVRADARGRLTGRADPTPWAPVADLALVVAQEDGGPAVFQLDLDPAARPAAEPAMDLTRPIGWLDLAGVDATRLGGTTLATALLDRGAAFTAAEMLGGAQRALDLAVEYAKDRIQFDRPIGSFQAVKHRCADMLVDVEGMRSTALWAAWCLGAGDDASVAASTAKTWGSDASRRVMASALQVHGGIGFTWEHDLHLFLKRAQLDQLAFGDAAFHRARLAALLRPRVVAGESVV